MKIDESMVERAADTYWEQSPNKAKSMCLPAMRAALTAALGDVEPEPLESVLGEEGTIDRVLFDSQDWYAAVLLPEGYGSAEGPTIDAAIRAAVANAKGGE